MKRTDLGWRRLLNFLLVLVAGLKTVAGGARAGDRFDECWTCQSDWSERRMRSPERNWWTRSRFSAVAADPDSIRHRYWSLSSAAAGAAGAAGAANAPGLVMS